MSFDRPRSNDNPPRTPQARAEALRQKYRGHWMVLWSVWESCFIAYPTWIGSGGHMIRAASETDLERAMAETEQAARPPQAPQGHQRFYGGRP